jgi:hypothetical protein
MIPMHRWDVCVGPLESTKNLKGGFPFKFLKISECAARHFNITTQMRSVMSDDFLFCGLSQSK